MSRNNEDRDSERQERRERLSDRMARATVFLWLGGDVVHQLVQRGRREPKGGFRNIGGSKVKPWDWIRHNYDRSLGELAGRLKLSVCCATVG